MAQNQDSAAANVLVLVGSLRAASINKQLAELAVESAPEGVTLQVFDRLGELPHYNEDIDTEDVAEPVQALRAAAAAAGAALVVTPEYNGSIPGVLKNAIDHASRPYGQSAWAGKPAGVIGISVGPIGTSLAQQHLRNVLAYLDVPTMGQPEAFIHLTEGKIDAAGEVSDDKLRSVLQRWVDAYQQFVEAHVGNAR